MIFMIGKFRKILQFPLDFTSKNIDWVQVSIFSIIFGALYLSLHLERKIDFTVIISSLAAWFAYLSYRLSIEKMRLEL
jgi:hypothetical protein